MDSFFGIGIFELMMIAVIALLVLGPERLPSAMREIAKFIRQLRDISSEFQSQFSDELKMLDEINPRRIINEAIDPKTPSAPAKPAAPAPAKPAAAKPAAAAPAAKAPAIGAPAAAALAAPVVVNGESENSILPPAKSAPPADPAAAAPPPAPPVESPAAGEPPFPAQDVPPAPPAKSAPPADPNGPADPGAADTPGAEAAA